MANGETSGHVPDLRGNWAGYSGAYLTDNPNRNAKELNSWHATGLRPGIVVNSGLPLRRIRRQSLWTLERDETRCVDVAATTTEMRPIPWLVVEIDPFDRTRGRRSETALGRSRMKCRGSALWRQASRSYVQGCDARNEYIYKYVSNRKWNPSDAKRGLAAGDKYMDDGSCMPPGSTADGSGDWLELTFGVNNITPRICVPFSNQADVVVTLAWRRCRRRHERWIDRNGARVISQWRVYVTLTNTNAASRPLTSLMPPTALLQ